MNNNLSYIRLAVSSGVPKGSILKQVFSDDFISDLNRRVKYILSKFAEKIVCHNIKGTILECPKEDNKSLKGIFMRSS